MMGRREKRCSGVGIKRGAAQWDQLGSGPDPAKWKKPAKGWPSAVSTSVRAA